MKIIYQNFCQLPFGRAWFTAAELVEEEAGGQGAGSREQGAGSREQG
ncbi:hypothetical protein [Nostoc sp.]